MASFDWIVWIVVICIIVVLIMLILKNTLFYFESMDKSVVNATKLKIPVGDIELNARIIYPKYACDENGVPKKKLPLIFFNHGWGGGINLPFTSQYVYSLAVGGPYAVLMYDCRGHGKSPRGKKDGKKGKMEMIFDDAPKIIDFGLQLPTIDAEKAGFVGFSMGAEIALTRAYVDKRIKATIAISTPSNAKENFGRKPENLFVRLNQLFTKITGVNAKNISEEMNRSISPEFIIDRGNKEFNNRVMLIHAINDPTISFKQFLKNREALDLPDENVLILKKGGHTLLHQEALTIPAALRFFKKILG